MERKEDLERPTNMLSKSSSNAACLTGVLRANDTVECLHRVGATVALAQVITVAWPSCLGAGAVAQGVGGSHRAEAAEVRAGLRRLRSFTAPTPAISLFLGKHSPTVTFTSNKWANLT
jgi:hypothetical protein